MKFDNEYMNKKNGSEGSDDEGEYDTQGKLVASDTTKKKHRTIKDVIEIVLAWKRFKKGVKNKKGKFVKFTPQEAAEVLGISYKTLYDYMFFLK